MDIKLNEKYSNFKPFKNGGMGILYKGIEKTKNEDVVLKLIKIENKDDEKLFLREIEASKNLIHYNISKVRRTGKIKHDDVDCFYIIQDYYPKGNLRTIIKNNIELKKCIEMMYELLNGVKEIHKIFIHRDLKPENILIDNDGHLRITDFGIVKYIDNKTHTKTFKGFGTFPYMAPECWVNGKNTKAMDIYALGIIFFEIVTGKLPFKAKNESDWKEAHLHETLPNISNYRNIIDSVKLNEIIQKMTMKDIEKRYGTIDEVINALDDYKKNIDNYELAIKASEAVQNEIKEILKIKKDNNELDEKINNFNYHISSLFEHYKKQVSIINEKLESERIKIYEETDKNEPSVKILKIKFNKKTIIIRIEGYYLVEVLEKRKPQLLQDSFLKLNNIVLIGYAELEYKINCNEYGYNLFLSKNKNNFYGEWYIMLIQNNNESPDQYFPIISKDFINSYENAIKRKDHKIVYRKLEESDINEIIGKLFD